MNDRFQASYAQLNDNQRLAVDTIEGPVMVVAGPGTGKTQVLTLRIANILRQTQMNPRNILALTFTDSAAGNMRTRLVSIIGSGAYGVGIHTYHSFARLVMSEFSYKFHFAKELRLIEDIERYQIMENLIQTLPLELLRPLGNPTHYLREANQTISKLKKENIEPERLKTVAKAQILQLQTNPDNISKRGPTKGKLRADINDQIVRLERNLELADIYAGYQAELKRLGLYDYDDMILFVIDALENDPDLKAYYQERFQYILVDEYQDTNNSQNQLITLLTDFFDAPNLFVVGDDKQSIFRFQGASMANLLLLYKKYPSLKIISLKENYRSNQSILDTSQTIIDLALERITHHLDGVSDQLTAVNQEKVTHGPPVNLAVFNSKEVETYFVANYAKRLIDQGVDPAEIAIIYKNNNEAEPLADILNRLAVPYVLERGSDILYDKDIRRLLTIMSAVEQPTDSRALFETLHYDFSGLNGVDIFKLLSYRAKTRNSLIECLTDLPCDCPSHGQKGDKAINFTDCQKIVNHLKLIGQWRIDSRNMSMPALVEKILNESGLLKQIVESPGRVERLHRLGRFFEEIKKINLRLRELTLAQLLEHFEQMKASKTELVPQAFDYGQNTKAVRLLTAHKAKGLEFSHVFIINLVDGHWGDKTFNQLIKLPTGLIPGLENDSKEQRNEDDRRLFYVALTRAKHCLYLSYAENHDGKTKLPTKYLAEIEELKINRIDTKRSEEEMTKQLMTTFAPVRETEFSELETEYLRAQIKDNPLTVTALNNYLRCPKGYFYKNLLRIPGTRTPQQSFGDAIHKALQALFEQQKVIGTLPKLDFLLDSFHSFINNEILSPTELSDLSRKGIKVLTKYYEEVLPTTAPFVEIEYNLDSHHITLPSPDGDIWITGRIDKIEVVDPEAKTYRIIDYKTGRARSRNEIEGKSAKADQDYLRQLIFYQLLTDVDRQFPYRVVETGLAFVDRDLKFSTEKFVITKQQTAELKELIQQKYSEMLSLNFPHFENPNRPPCEFCHL